MHHLNEFLFAVINLINNLITSTLKYFRVPNTIKCITSESEKKYMKEKARKLQFNKGYSCLYRYISWKKIRISFSNDLFRCLEFI